ncbi:MAG TPA: hypothetical protein VK871_12645 [Candidatus Limnocylindrales bacterium]|nr:hypothetical protein [Candidatus Limnocylindrales bacterium]
MQATETTNPPAGRPGQAGIASGGPFTGGEPPDPFVAAGPDHVMQVTNHAFRVFDRAGNDLYGDIGLADFFNYPAPGPGVPDFFVSDPRVHYDSLHGRWLMTELAWTCDAFDGHAYGFIDIAVSGSADPTRDWTLWYWYFVDALPDYPALGTSTDKIAVGSNVFDLSVGCGGGSFIASDIIVFDWADLLAEGDLGTPNQLDFGERFDTSGATFTPRIAVQTPATSPVLRGVMQYDDPMDGLSELHPYYHAVVGSAVAGTLATSIEGDLTASGAAGAWVEPPPPQQPGSPAIVTDAIDSRPTDAIWTRNRLAFVSTHGCTPVGDMTLRSCVRVTELKTAANGATMATGAQDFLVGANGRDNYFGGIGFAQDGTIHVVWTRSSTTAGDYPSSVSSYQLPADANNQISPPEVLAAGLGTYDGPSAGGRWGDYVGVAQDPQVPNAVWQGNQYSGGGASWLTKVSQLQTGGTSYVPIEPVRVLDTRPAFSIGLVGAFAANVPRSFAVAGAFTIPADAVAVTGNVTVANQTAGGYLSVTPSPVVNPLSSTVNFPLGDTRANNLTVPLASDGKLAAVYKAPAGKTTHLIVDITGYFLAGDEDATYATLAPVRVLDTRPVFNIGLTGAFQPNVPRTLSIADANGIPADATAITGNLTVTGQTRAGYLSITPDPDPTPATSTLNFPLGDTRANGVSVPLNAEGDLSIVYKASGGSTHVILDVTGYYRDTPSGLLFYPLTPGRVMDTRPNVLLSGLSGAFAASIPRRLDVAGHWGAPVGANAITGNLTIVNQTAAGYVSATLTADANPTTSVLNFPLGDTRANGVTLPLNGQGREWFVYKAPGGKSAHLILDLSGYFD